MARWHGWMMGLAVAGSLPADLAWGQSGTVSGRIVTGPADRPLAGVMISVEGAHPAAMSDSVGRFLLRAVASGARVLEARRAGYQTTRVGLTVPASSTVEVEIIVDSLVAGGSATPPQDTLKRRPQRLDSLVTSGSRGTGYVPPPTVTPMKSALPVLAIPQSMQVVPRAVLDDQAVVLLQEAARNVAGVSTSYSFMGTTNSCVRIRGFSNEQGSVGGTYYRNGLRVWAQPLSFSTVESIEIVKGPNGALSGRNEPGGLVNVVTKRPVFQRVASFRQAGGSYSTFVTEADVGGALDAAKTVAGRLTGGYYTTDTFRDRSPERLASLNGGLTWLAGAATDVTVSVDYTRQVYRPDFGLPAVGDRPADVPITRAYTQDYKDSKTTALLTEVDARHRFSSTWQLAARGSYLHVTPRYFNVYAYGLDEQTRQYPVYYFGEEFSTRKTWQVNADLIGRVRTGGVRHDLVLGVDHFDEDYDGPIFFSDAAPPLDFDNPDIGSAPQIHPTRADYSPWVGIAKWTGLYVQDQISLGERAVITVGLRHDRTRALFGDPTTTDPVDHNATKPRVGLTVFATPRWTLFGQYQGSLGPNNGRSATGETFRPQEAEEVEIGTKVEGPSRRWLVSVALFQLTKKRLLTADLSTPDPSDRVAVGRVRNRGLEVDFSGALDDRVSVIASYAFSNARITEDALGNEGNRYEGVPRHAGSVWGAVQAARAVRFGLGVFAEGDRPGDLGNTFTLPGYARVDAMAQYRFRLGTSRAALQLNATNLFDVRWWAGVYNNSRDFILPGTPRQLLGSVRVDL